MSAASRCWGKRRFPWNGTPFFTASFRRIPTIWTSRRAVREYMTKRMSLSPSSQDTVPLYLELTGSVAGTASVLGIPYETSLPLTDYQEAAACLEELAAAGIDRTVLSYRAWSGDIPFRKIPIKAAASGKLGGQKRYGPFVGGRCRCE